MSFNLFLDIKPVNHQDLRALTLWKWRVRLHYIHDPERFQNLYYFFIAEIGYSAVL